MNASQRAGVIGRRTILKAGAAAAALASATTHGDNDYKPELARRTLVRALLQAKTMSPGNAEV